jgi:two-component sensor histidine kinase
MTDLPPIDETAEAEDRAARRALDRSVFRLVAIFWSLHLAFIVARSLLLKVEDTPAGFFVRVYGSVTAALLTYGLHLLISRHGPRTGGARLAWVLALAIPTCVVFVFINEFYFMSFTDTFAAHGGVPQIGEVFFDLSFFVWVFAAWAGLYLTTVQQAELRARERRLAEVRRAAQSAQLDALRFQLNPHFFFNALNTLSGLIRLNRPDEAERAVLSLSDFLRHTLASPAGETRLEGELDAQRLYLSIEQLRFGDRLSVRFDIEDEAEQCLVPSLILQPLVENAVKHGVAGSDGPAEVRIAARVEHATLRVRVENTLPPEGAAEPVGLKVGLENVRRRLAVTYGPDGALAAGPTGAPPDGRWRSEIVLPARAA